MASAPSDGLETNTNPISHPCIAVAGAASALAAQPTKASSPTPPAIRRERLTAWPLRASPSAGPTSGAPWAWATSSART